jgi:hypothetical protein
MSTQPSYRAVSVTQPSSTAGHPQPFQEFLADCATIRVHKKDLSSFKYALHLPLFKQEVVSRPVRHGGWIPMGYRAAGAIALRMDYTGAGILGQPFKDLSHKQWMTIIDRLGVFTNALDRLAFSPQLKAQVEWKTHPGMCFERNVWLRSHWQWLRTREENPGLATLTISLSEAVAAAETNALKAASTARVALTAPRARRMPGLN